MGMSLICARCNAVSFLRRQTPPSHPTSTRSKMDMLDDESLQKLYAWVDKVPLSRAKRNMHRDFSDGLLTAEIVHFYFPKLVQLHNYTAANSIQQKLYNWNTLNQKVFRKLSYQMPPSLIDDIVKCKSGAIETCLMKLQQKIASKSESDFAKPSPSPPRKSTIAMNESTRLAVPTRVKYDSGNIHQQVNQDILMEKELVIQEQRETIQILELKVQKLEQLIRLKDGKIQTLVSKLQEGHQQM